MFSENQLRGANVCFLLELEIFSATYRFSSFPCELLSTATGNSIPFEGGLEDIDFSESSKMTGIDIEANNLSTAIIFDGIDVIEMWRKGFPIEGSSGEVSFVLFEEGEPQQTYENRVLLTSGLVEEPIFGDPADPKGFLAFTLERQPWNPAKIEGNGGFLHELRMKITSSNFPSHDDSAAGKIFPIILGGGEQPNGIIEDTITVPHTANSRAFPAYCIKIHTPASPPAYFLISAGRIFSETVGMWDPYDNFDTFTVQTATDVFGNLYSYIDATAGIAGTTFQYPGITLLGQPEPQKKEWWITLNAGTVTKRGGLTNPFGEGALSGGGDICLWVLTTCGIDIDESAWQSLAPILNEYKFCGYIGERLEGWKFLTEKILPFLPIEVRNGPKGIKPILSLVYATSSVLPIRSIQINAGFQLVGPIETQTNSADIRNTITIDFGLDAKTDTYIGAGSTGPDIRTGYENTGSDYAKYSVARYGKKIESFETDFIYHRPTIFRAMYWLLRSMAFPIRTAKFRADVRYGFLEVGEVVELNSSSLYMTKTKAIITGREWSGDSWLFEIAFEDTPIMMARA